MISIVILNWNDKKYVLDCIESIYNQTYKDYEVIFVDNASTNNSLDIVEMKFPQLNYVRNKENFGFAKGMNIGISVAKGDFIMLLNTDVYLAVNYLEECIKEFADNDVGLVAGRELLWENGNKTLTPAFSGVYGIRLRLQVHSTSKTCNPVFGVSGSFPIVRREMVNEVISLTGSFFDENFGTGWEDNDMRFLLAFTNWKTIFVPNATAWHVGSASDNEQKSLYKKNIGYQKRIFRNRFYIQYKYVSGSFYWWNMLLHLVNIFIPLYLLLRHPYSVVPYFSGYKEFLRNRIIYSKFRNEILPTLRINKNGHLNKNYFIGF